MYKFLLVVALISTACTSPSGDGANASTPGFPETSAGQEPSLVTMKVILTSPDGTRIVGSLYEAAYVKSPGVILLHQWQSDRHSFDELASRLQKRRINVLSIDGRGFGESTETIDGKRVKPEHSAAAVKAMLRDVQTAVDFLAKQKNVDPNRIGIVGASYGSSLAIMYAAEHPELRAVGLLSPGVNYFGSMPIEQAVKKFWNRSGALFFAAAEDDKESFNTVRKLNPIVVDNRLHGQHILKVGGHGTDLLKAGVSDSVSDFLAAAFDLSNLHLNP